ncbi:hypothetical protein [Pyrobaculum aerophilum]|uniref:Uncharacterized protein n=2 Tax=Pyrobaculum aerophilum TaxID=13773 RepID=A0A371R0V9_9CREN|nr:hypothetical protein [Pyrobaculum aerophilum]RFA96929.1 hypothetical protein CGL52_10185 [Pyrobaculum aerophilum]
MSLSATPYIDNAVIVLKQCLCMEPQWLYLDVWAHVSGGAGALKLYWYDGGWQGACNVGNGTEAYNICSIPYASSAVALVLYHNGVEVDGIEIWGVGPRNATCSATPMIYVLNWTTTYQRSTAVLTLRSIMFNTIAAVFHSNNYTISKTLSIRGLNPCDDYVIKLVFHMAAPSPWKVEIVGNMSNAPATITVTTTKTSTITAAEVITSTAIKAVAETAIRPVTVTETYTVTETKIVREADPQSVYIAALGVFALIIALAIFIVAYLRK